jgi:hypothetical protein
MTMIWRIYSTLPSLITILGLQLILYGKKGFYQNILNAILVLYGKILKYASCIVLYCSALSLLSIK